MNRRAMLTCAIAFAAACSDSPTTPSSTSPTTFRANIAAPNELPAITGPEAGATRTVTITLNATKDADGLVTGGTLDFSSSLNGFPAATTITAAHIHAGNNTVSGAIIQDTGLTAQGGVTLANGSGTITLRSVPVSGPVANALLANPAIYYFNVHSVLNPGGAARGQLIFP